MADGLVISFYKRMYTHVVFILGNLKACPAIFVHFEALETQYTPLYTFNVLFQTED